MAQFDEVAQANRLLECVTRAQSQYFRGADPSELFNGLLVDLLDLTASAYGYIAEVLYDDEGAPYLKTWAITNIAWNDATREMYEQHVVSGEGLEFRNLDTLFGWGLRDGGRVVIANDPAGDPHSSGRPDGHPPLDSYLAVPIFRGATLVGQFGVANRAGGFHEGIVESLRPFTAAAGNLIDALRADNERREAEQERMASEQRLTAVVAHLSEVVTVLGDDGSWVSSSPAGSRLLGYGRGASWTGGIFALLHPDDVGLAREALDEVMAGVRGPDASVDLRVRATDGSYRIFETRGDDLRGNPAIAGVVLTSHDVTERRFTERRLHERSAELATLVANLSDGVLFTDAEQIIVFANQTFCDLFELSQRPEDLVGRPSALIRNRSARMVVDPEEFLERIESKQRSGEPVSAEIVHFHDGRVIECDYTPVEHDTDSRGYLWIYHDVTARTLLDAERLVVLERTISVSMKEREMRLGIEEQNRSLRELDQLKNEFVAAVSHELRTPLTSIVSFADLLSDDAESLSKEQQEFIGIIERNARRLLDIVNDLLLIAELESGGLGIEPVPTRLADLIEQSVAAFGAAVGAKDLTLGLELSTDATLALIDPLRFDQVVANLLSNAVKFTPAGGAIGVSTQRVPGAWSIVVSDTGIGIPRGEVDRLFERFFRGSNARLEALPGTGLGLAITGAIVDLHGGSLDMQSEEGRGTTVTITLPDALDAPKVETR